MLIRYQRRKEKMMKKLSEQVLKHTSHNRLLILVGDDSESYDLIQAYFKPKGYTVTFLETTSEALSAAETEGPHWDLLITDFEKTETQFIADIKAMLPELPIIQIIQSSEMTRVTDSNESSIFDFIAKPIPLFQLHIAVEKALSTAVESKNQLQQKQNASTNLKSMKNKIIGTNPLFLKALEICEKVASCTANIFICGESGTGKEIFAKYIHEQGKCSKGPFVAINCSAIPENLLESELFGHAKGSFTGAIDKKLGLFEEAQDGTLFLDEIGDLSFSLQSKLLRVLQDRKIKRVGENQYRAVNCRIISATHKDLTVEVNEGRFREDLFFRLNVIPIGIPPLRNRPEDLIPLAEFFLKKYAAENNSFVNSFSPEAIKFICDNPWRGNVRELENSVERAVILSQKPQISIDNFMPTASQLINKTDPTKESVSLSTTDFSIQVTDELPTLNYVVNKYIEYAVSKNYGARDKTAKEIGIDRKTLYKRMKFGELLTHQMSLF